MRDKNLTIFANMMINDEKRLRHLKDSFYSFKNISDDWLINVRGNFREEAIKFLKENLGNKIKLFELLDENRGWFVNSLDMVRDIKNDYILLWNEDHINMAQSDIYGNIIEEMKGNNVNYLTYTWWLDGKYKKAFEVDDLRSGKFIDVVYLTNKKWKKQLKKGYNYYIISMAGIFSKDFFVKLLKREGKKLPLAITTNIFRAMIVLKKIGLKFDRRKYYDLINKIFFYKLTRWPMDRPFNIEKSPYRFDVLPIKIGLPRQELFACINDDLDVEGSQLIKRGLYPNFDELRVNSIKIDSALRNERELLEKNNHYTIYKVFLSSGTKYGGRYYENEVRTDELLRKTIILLNGNLIILVGNTGKKMVELAAGQTISIYPSINHIVKAKNNSSFIEVYSSLHNKKIKYII